MDPYTLNIIILYGAVVPSYDSFPKEWRPSIRRSDIPGHSFQVVSHSLKYQIRNATDFSDLTKVNTDLLSFLAGLIHDEPQIPRPQIYICYGLAGIALKSALRRAWNLREGNSTYRRLVHASAGFVFLSTPHVHNVENATAQLLSKFVVPDDSNRRLRKGIQKLPLSDLTRLNSDFKACFSLHHVFSGFDRRQKSSVSNSLFAFKREKNKKLSGDISVVGVEHEECLEIDNIRDAVRNEDSQLWQGIKRFLRRVCDEVPTEIRTRYATMDDIPPRADKVWTETATNNQDSNLNPGSTPQPAPQSDLGQRDQAVKDVLLLDNNAREADLCVPCEYLDAKPRLSKALFGRSRDLEAIDNIFLPNDLPQTQADLNNRNVVTYCLTGIGGAGKTRIAAEYVMTRAQNFDVIAWVNADSITKLLDGYAEFAAKLGLISLTPRPEDSIVLNHVNAWFGRPVRNQSQTEGPFVRWLLVIDNVNQSDDMLPEHWPHEGRGAVLVVGRDPRNRTESRFGTSGHEIKELTPDDAITMLLQITDKSNEPSAATSAKKIIDVWGSLPLSLLCVAGIIDNDGLSLSLCAGFGTTKRDQLFDDSKWRYATNEYSWASIWALENLTPSAMSLLETMALLDAEGIPATLLRQSVTIGPGTILSAEDFEASRKLLWRLALIGMDATGTSLTVPMAIQQTILARLRKDPDRFATIYQAAVSLISGYWPAVLTEEVNFSTRDTLTQDERCDELKTHAERLIQIHEQENGEGKEPSFISYNFLRLSLEYTWYALDRQRLIQAEAFLSLISSHMKPTSEAYYKSMHVAYCTSKLRMANLTSDYTTALAFASTKLDILESIRDETGEISQKLCSAYTEKAMAWIGTGEFSEGAILQLLRTSTEIRQALPGFKLSQLFSALRCEATLYKVMGRLEEAQNCYQRAYADRISEMGEESSHTNIRTGIILGDLADVYCRQGRWQAGHDHFHRSLSIMRRIHRNEPEHEHFGWIYFRLGQVDMQLGNLEEASNHLRSALRIRQLGTTNQREKARVLYASYEVANKLGNKDNADAYLQNAARLRASILREDGRIAETLTRLDFDYLRDRLE